MGVHEELQIDIKKSGEQNCDVKFTAKGRVTTLSAEKLDSYLSEMIKPETGTIILNMADVDLLTSVGIRVILKTFKESRKEGIKFFIEAPSQNVRNVLGLSALEAMLLK